MEDHYDYFLDLSAIEPDLDLVVHNIGFSHNQPNYSYGYDRREYYILHYVISGNGTYTIDNNTYTLNENDGFLVVPNKTVIYRADQHNPWSVYWVGFHGAKAEYYLKKMNINLQSPVFHNNDHNAIVKCMEAMYANAIKQPILYESVLGSLYQLIGIFERQYVSDTSSFVENAQYYYSKTVTYIHNNIRFPLKVTTIADMLGLSCSQTYRIIVKESGLTPHALIEKLKVERACELLETTNISIHEIASLVGYDYLSHFSVIFKKQTGVTPGAYRKQTRLCASQKSGEERISNK